MSDPTPYPPYQLCKYYFAWNRLLNPISPNLISSRPVCLYPLHLILFCLIPVCLFQFCIEPFRLIVVLRNQSRFAEYNFVIYIYVWKLLGTCFLDLWLALSSSFNFAIARGDLTRHWWSQMPVGVTFFWVGLQDVCSRIAMILDACL